MYPRRKKNKLNTNNKKQEKNMSVEGGGGGHGGGMAGHNLIIRSIDINEWRQSGGWGKDAVAGLLHSAY